MNKNTKIRIKVPKSLYESIQQQIKKESVKTQEAGQYYSERAMKGGIQMENDDQLNENLENTLMDLVRQFGPEALMTGIVMLGAKLGIDLQNRSDSGEGNPNLDRTMGQGIEGNRFEKGNAQSNKPSTMGEKKSHGEEEEGVVKEFSMEQLSEAVKKAKAKKAAAAKEKEKAAAAKEKEKEAAKKEKEKEAAKKK
jgi:hypothetical protein